MAVRHTVQQGECLYSLAAEYGWFPETLWDQPENADLKRLRGRGDVLCPGDVLVIPDKRRRVEKVPTGASHRFRRKGIPHQLSVRVMSLGAPLADRPYRLAVDGVDVAEGTTDGDGWVRCGIDPRARQATLVVDDLYEHRLALGHLDPVEERSGLQQRLANLGYYPGPIAAQAAGPLDDATADALARFQRAQGLDPSGQVDDATKDRLKALNGA